MKREYAEYIIEVEQGVYGITRRGVEDIIDARAGIMCIGTEGNNILVVATTEGILSLHDALYVRLDCFNVEIVDTRPFNRFSRDVPCATREELLAGIFAPFTQRS